VAAVVGPALALGAVALALLTQFAIVEDWDLWRPWLGFLTAAVMLGSAVVLASRSSARASAEPLAITRRQELLLFAAVIAVAAFFRLYRFYEFPPGIWSDEGVNALDAIYIIEHDHFTVWRETVLGRSTLYLYLLAGSFKVFGFNLFALRIVPVLAGLGAVVAFYFLVRELAGVVAALVGTALLAVSRWATTFSRISWEASLVPLLEIMSVYFLVRALETRSRLFFFLAGGSLAAGLYTYVAFRIVPVVMLMLLAYVVATQWRLLRTNIPGLVIYGLSFLLVVAPLGQFALTNQDKVLERTRDVNVFQEVEDKDSYEPLRLNLEANVKMLNAAGDRNPRHNLPGEPMVDEVTAALFVLGIAASVWSFRSWRRGSAFPWYVLMLVPGALTVTIENPSGIRTLGAIVPLYLLAGIAASALHQGMATSRAGVAAFTVVAGALVVSAAGINYYDLFERQANDARVHDEFQTPARAALDVVVAEAGEKQVFVTRQFDGHPAFPALARGKPHHPYIAARDLIFPADGRDVLIIADPRQYAIVPALRSLYPDLTIDDYTDQFGELYFWKINIPATYVDERRRIPMSIDDGAIQRAPLDREWTEDDLTQGPVDVTWDGFIWSTAYPADTTITLQAPGHVRVEVAGHTAEGDGEAQLVAQLPYGEHAVRLTARIERPGRVEGQFVQGGVPVTHLADEFYGTSLRGNGFLALHRRGDQFGLEPEATHEIPFASPIPALIGRAIEYQGLLTVDAAGTYGFAVDSANSVQVFVDDQLVVDNGGAHSLRRVEGEIPLEPGEHRVAIQYIVSDRPDWSLEWRLAGTAEWRLMDGREFSVPSEPFRHEGLVRLEPDPSWGAGGVATLPDVEGVTGIALLPDGRIVASTRDQLILLDAESNILSRIPVDARDIADIATASDGRIIVADRATNSLLVLDSDGALVRRIEGQFASVAGVGASDGAALVASPLGGFLYEASLDDGAVTLLPMSQPDQDLRARQPSDIAGSGESVFVADFENKRVIIGTAEAGERAVSGVGGSGAQVPRLALFGQLIFVSEPAAERILILDLEGKQRGAYIFPPGRPPTRPAAMVATDGGLLYVADLTSGKVHRLRINVEAPTEPASAQ